MPKQNELSAMQRQFIDEYAKCADGTEAAKRAGYSHPAVAASKLLRLPKVKEQLTKVNEALDNKTVADMAEINEFWTKVIRGEVEETTVGRDGQEVKTPVRMTDRIKASELRAKVMGAFVDRQENSGTITIELSGELLKWAK